MIFFNISFIKTNVGSINKLERNFSSQSYERVLSLIIKNECLMNLEEELEVFV